MLGRSHALHEGWGVLLQPFFMSASWRGVLCGSCGGPNARQVLFSSFPFLGCHINLNMDSKSCSELWLQQDTREDVSAVLLKQGLSHWWNTPLQGKSFHSTKRPANTTLIFCFLEHIFFPFYLRRGICFFFFLFGGGGENGKTYMSCYRVGFIKTGFLSLASLR